MKFHNQFERIWNYWVKSFRAQVLMYTMTVVIVLDVYCLNAAQIPTIVLPQKEFVVFELDIVFKNPKMTNSKVIDYPNYKRIGICKGDSLYFEVKLTPNITLDDTQYHWSGEENGTGATISIVFSNTGNKSESVTIENTTKTGFISVVEIPPPNETIWGIINWTLVSKVKSCADKATQWAYDNSVLLGGGIHNGRADAARHAYWNVLMSIEMDAAVAEGAATAHEKSNYDNNDPHNESVMDLENNSRGRNIGTGLPSGSSETDCQNAVINALDAGNLTILDDLTNVNEVGLLQPSNK